MTFSRFHGHRQGEPSAGRAAFVVKTSAMIRLHSAVLLLLSSVAFAQTQTTVTILRCGSLFDGKSDQHRRNVAITITGDKITAVGESAPPAGGNTVDLS